MSAKKIVIVGGGFGGLSAVKALRNAKADVLLIDKQNHHLFQPLLYQVATATLSPADIAAPIRHILKGQKNAQIWLSEVESVNHDGSEVILVGGKRVYFDYLILATGARYNYFTHPEWEAAAPSLKTISDALQIRERILLSFEKAEMEIDAKVEERLLTFLIVGGGPTGVEMAGAIAEVAHRSLVKDFRLINSASSKIILLEAGPRILSSYPDWLIQKAVRDLELLGVNVRVNAKVSRIENDGLWIGDEKLYSSNIIWTAGVLATPVGRWLNVPVDSIGRVKVQADLSVPGMQNIFVIGDAAHCEEKPGGQPLPGLAPVAAQQGRFVANLLNRRLGMGLNYSAVFKYKDKGKLATIGRAKAVAEFGKFELSGLTAWVSWLAVHIYYLIGFRNRMIVLMQWAWSYVTFQRGARLITGSFKK